LDQHFESTGIQLAKLQSMLVEVKVQLTDDIATLYRKLSDLESKFDTTIKKDEQSETQIEKLAQNQEDHREKDRNKELELTIDRVVREKNTLENECASLRQTVAMNKKDADLQLKKKITEITEHKNNELESLQLALHQKTKEIEELQKKLEMSETSNKYKPLMTQQVPAVVEKESSTNHVSEKLDAQCGSLDQPITQEDKREEVKSGVYSMYAYVSKKFYLLQKFYI